jgi:hypothetical protein
VQPADPFAALAGAPSAVTARSIRTKAASIVRRDWRARRARMSSTRDVAPRTRPKTRWAWKLLASAIFRALNTAYPDAGQIDLHEHPGGKQPDR